MTFNDLLTEAMLSQDRIMEAIITQRKQRLQIEKTEKQHYSMIYDEYYKLSGESIVYKHPIKYQALEEILTCDQVLYQKCLDTLKQYDIVNIYGFVENEKQKIFNHDNCWIMKNDDIENSDLFRFICRINEWFFIASLNIHQLNMGKRFECKYFYNCSTKESMDLRCTIFFESQRSKYSWQKKYHDNNTDIIFDIINSSSSHSNYMDQKWAFLNILSDQLNSDGYKNVYESNFKLFPHKFPIKITEPVKISLSFDFFPQPIIRINEGNYTIIEINYVSLDDYAKLKNILESYTLYIKNQYGEYDKSKNIYYNDKNVCQLFNIFQNAHERKYTNCYNSQHGTIKLVHRVKNGFSDNSSEHYLHGVDLINAVFCDVQYIVEFGQFVIKPDTTSDNTMSCCGSEFEKYIFSVKMYMTDNQIITKYIIEQMTKNKMMTSDDPFLTEGQRHNCVLKNKVESEGQYLNMQEDIKFCLLNLYQAYNMPLNV